MINGILKCVAATAVASMALVSCTISEPETPKGEASNLRFKAMTSYGMTLISASYDTQNRITELNWAGDIVYVFSYEGTGRIPSAVMSTEYEEYDVNDKTVSKPRIIENWSNIKANNDGYITSFSCIEKLIEWDTRWNDDTEKYELVNTGEHMDNWETTLTYDGNYLTYRDDEYANGEHEVEEYTWTDGLLMSYTDNDPEYPEWGIYEYSDVDNVLGQWDPNNQAIGALGITGFFGKAPKKFMKSETQYRDDVKESFIQYSYALMENGLIKAVKIADTDEEATMVFNFVYEKVK